MPIEAILKIVIGRSLSKTDGAQALQDKIYSEDLHAEKQEDALLYLNGLFRKYGQKSADVLKLTRKLPRKRTA